MSPSNWSRVGLTRPTEGATGTVHDPRRAKDTPPDPSAPQTGRNPLHVALPGVGSSTADRLFFLLSPRRRPKTCPSV